MIFLDSKKMDQNEISSQLSTFGYTFVSYACGSLLDYLI